MGKAPVNYGEPGSATSAAPAPGATTVTAGSGSCGPREGGSSSTSAAPTTGAAPRSGMAALPRVVKTFPPPESPPGPDPIPRKLAVAAAHFTVVAGNDAASAPAAAATGDDERADAIRTR